MFKRVIVLFFIIAAAGCAVEEKAEDVLLHEIATRLGVALHKKQDDTAKTFKFPITITLQADEE